MTGRAPRLPHTSDPARPDARRLYEVKKEAISMEYPGVRPMALGSNIKMYLTLRETVDWLTMIRAAVDGLEGVDRFFFPTTPALWLAREILRPAGIGYGAQNMHWEASGPFTGEVSPIVLKELGCTHVELGHAERRQLFGETDEIIAKKVKAALTHQLKPVLCVGEPDKSSTPAALEVVSRQLIIGLSGASPKQLGEIIVAYEPAWAIGSGEAAPPAYVAEVHSQIRALLAREYGDCSEAPRVIYGGSVTPENAYELLGFSEVDGLFVGRSALRQATFVPLVDAIVARARERGVVSP